MLTVNRISKHYADQEILREISFSLTAGERVGLVGPNGCGKTTLFKIMMGQESADGGTVTVSAETRIGYLALGLSAAPEATVQNLLDAALGDPAGAQAEVERLAAALAETPGAAKVQRAYERALAHLQQVSARAESGAVLGTLKSLGLAEVPLSWPVAQLSGGQKTRLALALALLARPHLLLLDEPTNHLDLDMLLWLEKWLSAFRGAALIVSHDRAFLDATVTTILDLDAATHRLTAYPGNYSDYVEAKLRETQQQWQTYHDQQEEVARLQGAARHMRGLAKFKKGGKADTGDKFAKGFFANRGLETMKRAKQIERRIEQIQAEAVDKPKAGWQLKLAFDPASASGRDVLMMEDLAVGYSRPLLTHLNLMLRYGERVALIGPNGSGKTTLARTAIGQLPPLAGRVRLGASVAPGYFAQEQELLQPDLNALTTLQKVSPQSETDLRNFLHYFLFSGDDVFTPVASLSYGERARLALALLVARGCNFLVLDEPINHLDIPSRARFEQALKAFDGASLVIAHDRYFIERFATRIWKVQDGTVREYLDLESALRAPAQAERS